MNYFYSFSPLTFRILGIWDSLLEIRIQLQKVLVEANTLPQTPFDGLYKEIEESTTNGEVAEGEKHDFESTWKSCNGKIKALLGNLLELQVLYETNLNFQSIFPCSLCEAFYKWFMSFKIMSFIFLNLCI